MSKSATRSSFYTTSNFLYWAMNSLHVTQEWCAEVWGHGLGKHLYEKWQSRSTDFRTGSDMMLTWFFFQLSEDNQELLLDWVDNNYSYRK